MRRRLCLLALAWLACESPAPAPAPGAPAAPRPARVAEIDLRVSSPRGGCARSLVSTRGAAGHVGGQVTDAALASAIACLGGGDAPPIGHTVGARVRPLAGAAGSTCGGAWRITFRHDAVVVRGRCPSPGALAIEAEAVRGGTALTTLSVSGATFDVPWAGDWDGDGRLEWLLVLRAAERPVYLGVFGLDEDDHVVRLAEHRP